MNDRERAAKPWTFSSAFKFVPGAVTAVFRFMSMMQSYEPIISSAAERAYQTSCVTI